MTSAVAELLPRLPFWSDIFVNETLSPAFSSPPTLLHPPLSLCFISRVGGECIFSPVCSKRTAAYVTNGLLRCLFFYFFFLLRLMYSTRKYLLVKNAKTHFKGRVMEKKKHSIGLDWYLYSFCSSLFDHLPPLRRLKIEQEP